MAGMKSIGVLCGFLLLVSVVAVVGGWATGQGVRDWYPSLNKPSWTPPAWLFGPVWTLLYLAIAVSGWMVWREADARGLGWSGVRWGIILFALQLVLNAGWSWIFFAWRLPGWAFVEIVLLWCAILGTAVLFFRVSTTAGLLLVPYLMWVGFAAVLNGAIWRMN